MKNWKSLRSQNPRVLHCAALLNPSSGMLRQMQWEQDAADQLDIPWSAKMYCPNDIQSTAGVLHRDPVVSEHELSSGSKKLQSWLRLRASYHKWLLTQQDQYDIFLLRYYVHDPFQLWFLIRCQKPVLLVHHTLEGPELALSGSISSRFRSWLEGLVGPISISLSAGTVAVTHEILSYQRKRAYGTRHLSFIYANGISVSDRPLEDNRNTNIPEFLFVANFSPWHGLDILLERVKACDDKFVLHLVGSIPANLAQQINDLRIIYHGHLGANEIATLSRKCWVGLSSFALHRKKMQQACPLKTREYLALGLPVYADHEDVFPVGAPYFRRGNGNIEDLIAFAHQTRIFAKESIVAMARNHIDKIKLLSLLYVKLSNTL